MIAPISVRAAAVAILVALSGAACGYQTCSIWNLDPKLLGLPTQPTGVWVCKGPK